MKNIPDDLYQRLKAAAKAHNRSINDELIYCLETVLKPQPISPEKRLCRLRQLRPAIPPEAIDPEDIRRVIDEGRS